MTQKTKRYSRVISTPFYILFAVIAWYAVWLSTQALFMMNVPVLTDLLSRSDNEAALFAVYSAWIIALGLAATLLWAKWSKNNFSFLRVKNWKWIVLGYTPILLATLFIVLTKTVFEIPGWLWAPCLLATTFFQDILSFGFLQTALEKRIQPLAAVFLTASIFFGGHFWLVGNSLSLADPQVYIYAIGFPALAFLRYKTKTIYATNILHSAFHIFSVF